MKLSLATRIFLGYAMVLVTFGAVSLFSVAAMHENQVEIRLVSQGYLRLLQQASNINAYHAHQEAQTARVRAVADTRARRQLTQLARVFAPEMTRRLDEARRTAAETLEFAPDSEAPFLKSVAHELETLSRSYSEYADSAEAVFRALESEPVRAEVVDQGLLDVQAREGAIRGQIRLLVGSLESRIRQRVDESGRRERRIGVTILVLSVLAIAVGVIATLVAARTLRPVRTLIEGVSRIGRGDYSAQLGIRGEDEIATLAREFDQMARALRQREEQLRAQQEALVRAEQLAVVGRMSAQVAHEVRNPLSSIGLNVELLSDLMARARFGAEEDAQEARQTLASMNREVDRLTEVTEDYLRMARVPKPTLRPEDVQEIVRDVLAFSREELERARVDVVEEYDEGTPAALADEGQLRQVLLNLLRNSREAMPEGGKIVVRTRPVDGQVELSVQDSGKGMDEEVREHIFEPFFSTKKGGTGLGLAVTRQILQAHGGSILCESGPGQGTTFVLRFPAAGADGQARTAS